MHRFRLFLVVSTLVLCGLSCKEEVSSYGVQLNFEFHRLKNNLSVIMIQDKTVPVVSYQTWFRAGSVDDPPGMSGMTRLFEHLMFSGTEKYPSKDLFEFLELSGAEFNAITTRDYSMFYENVRPQFLEKIIDFESDRLANLTVNTESINKGRLIALEDRRQKIEEHPEILMEEALWQLAYKRHPYRWPIRGYPFHIMLITPERLVQFAKSYFQPANAILVVVGNFDSEQTLKWIQASYEKIPSKAPPERIFPEEPEQTEERRLEVPRADLHFEKLLQGYHIPAAEQLDAYALDVLTNILFEGVSSRAYESLVREKGLALSVSGLALTPTYPGLLSVSVTMRRGISSQKAERELDHLIREIQENGVKQSEVDLAVNQLKSQILDNFRNPFNLGQLVGIVNSILKAPGRVLDDIKLYSQIKPSDVQRVAQTYLDPNNRTVVVLVPQNNQGK